MPASKKAALELPAIRPSKYQNTDLSVAYIGNDACAKCHQDAHRSYLMTSHSRALELITGNEPPPESFQHHPSQREYSVSYDGKSMTHGEEWIGSRAAGDPASASEAGSEPVAPFRVEHPIKYAIGSGNHSRSYLCELDGFLIESPITWYASKQGWRMSPGYDHPGHQSFSRMVGVRCLACHAGRVEGKQVGEVEDLSHPVIQQMSIGCESCHGPGAAHQQHHLTTTHPVGEPDFTIVHLGRLGRAEQDSICAHCHLRGDATSLLRGRRLADYRPGLKLQDFRIDFSLVSDEGPMTVVGHIEQLHASRCFTESQDLSCTSCHDPHQAVAPDARVEYFRQKCAQCHAVDDGSAAQDQPQNNQEGGCKLAKAKRLEVSAKDDCVHCHMPRGDTDIPHFAFTHHRIGIHSGAGAQEPPPSKPPRLKPIGDVSHLPQAERDRALGLAYLEVATKAANGLHEEFHQREALRLLQGVRDQGMRDAEVESALARLAWYEEDHLKAIEHAQLCLDLDPLNVNALFVLAETLLKRQESHRALHVCQQLTNARRMAEDWMLLSQAHMQLEQPDLAVSALLTAAKISPFRKDVIAVLADTAQKVGDTAVEAAAAARLRQMGALE